MVFLVRRLRRMSDLKHYKILMVNDRRDLEAQLTTTAGLTGETITEINSAKEAKVKLATDGSNLNMVMIHKFREEDVSFLPDSVRKKIAAQHQAAVKSGDERRVAEAAANYQVDVARFSEFGTINNREQVLILIDEAHRTQRSGQDKGSLSDNLFDAFPNAARIAFTGTPLIADHHTDPTWKRFGASQSGAYIDKYKLKDAVDDNATLQIIYEGRTADTAIYDRTGFDTKFENLFKERTDEELLEIRKRYGAEGDILDAEKRIEEIATDLVKHYVRGIMPSGFKAQVVCASKLACIHYQTYIRKAITQHITDYEALAATAQNTEVLERLKFLKTAVIMSSDGTNEKADFVAARKESKELDAVESFKKAFNYDKPETGVAFLIVCDMLLTGFDAPIEQVMYIDKRLREHNLLQTIARVNRTYKEKTRGYIVDYIGLTENLKEALSLYAGEEQEDILDGLQSIDSEVPVLESRFRRLLQLFQEGGVKQIEELVNQKLVPEAHYQVQLSAVELLEDIRQRDSFNVYLKKFLQSMDIVMPNSLANPYKLPMYQLVHIQAKARERYKDETMNFHGVGQKVRALVNEHLVSLGMSPKVKPVELFSDEFVKSVKEEPDLKAQASEMEHAIRKHCKVNGDDDPVFYKSMSEKLDEIIKKHSDNWEQMALKLEALRDEILEGRGPDAKVEDPFFDLIVSLAFKEGDLAAHVAKVKETVVAIMDDLNEHIGNLDFWEREDLVAELQGKIKKRIILSRVPQLKTHRELLATEVVALARRREKDILGTNTGD